MKKLTRRRKEVLTTALNRERHKRPAQTKPRNYSERQAFDALVIGGYGIWSEDAFVLTSRGRSTAEALRREIR